MSQIVSLSSTVKCQYNLSRYEVIAGAFRKANFSCWSCVHRIGPSSSVVLTTTWLDGTMRLGRGSRGSRFVFLRGGYARAAGAPVAACHLASSLRLDYWALINGILF